MIGTKDWNTYFNNLKHTWIGQQRGDHKVLDITFKFDPIKQCKRTIAIVQCQVCGDTKHALLEQFKRGKYLHGSNCIDLHKYIGKTYGDMKILKHFTKNNSSYFLVECLVCHRKYTAQTSHFRDRTCNNHDMICLYGCATHRFKQIFRHMIRRCTDPNDKHFSDYGGRGIKVLWNSFEEFYHDMWDSYKTLMDDINETDLSIERIDVNGNYCKENCKWIPRAMQAKNTRLTSYFKLVDPQGHVYVDNRLTDFCRRHKLVSGSMHGVINGEDQQCYGWTGRSISKEEYEEYWRSQPIPADMDIVYETLEKCYNLRHKEGDTETYIPLVLFEAYYLGGYLPVEAIEALCTLDNTLNLSINYDYDKKRFTIKKKI